MNRLLLFLALIFLLQIPVAAEEAQPQENTATVYTEDNVNFGLKNENGTITPTSYKKLIRLSDHSWIVQHRSKFGIINADGEYIIKPKYRHAERLFGKYAKLGNDNDYGVYDGDGNIIVEPIYSRIDTLYGKMFLTYRKYKYGVVDMNGRILLPNEFEDIYMPTFKTMRIKYKGLWFEIEKADNGLSLPTRRDKLVINDTEYVITNILINTGIWSGYSALTITDYLAKIISSFSPAYEDTIDELMLSHGTDSVSIFMKLEWFPKFPVTYVQKYYRNLVKPNNGPLSDVREELKKQIK